MLLDMDSWKLNVSDVPASMKGLQKWLISMIDQINDCLCNIDEGNLNDAFYDTLTATKVVAETVISNTVITENLYAEYGDIAELTVDRLLTANKVSRYQDSDKSVINYIWIEDQSIKFMTGTTNGTTEQHKDRNGKLLYWYDANMTGMSTKATSYPVTVYQYTELCKMQISFVMDTESGYYTPKIVLGAGTGTNDNGKAFLFKSTDGVSLDYYSSTDGSLRRVLLNDDGIILTPYSLKSMDFYDNGFSAKYSAETVSMTWTKDGNGRITALTTEDNVTIPVSWNSGDM